VTDIICDPKGLPWIETCLIEEADIDVVLCEKMIQLDLPTTNAIGVPECESQGFTVLLLGRAVIFSYNDDYGC
jgi:hypothetical protein